MERQTTRFIVTQIYPNNRVFSLFLLRLFTKKTDLLSFPVFLSCIGFQPMNKKLRLIRVAAALLLAPTLVQCTSTTVAEKIAEENINTAYNSNISRPQTNIKNILSPSQELANSYLSKTPATAVTANLTLAQAEQIQAEFVQILSQTLGNPVGYKAALTSAPAQEKFGVSQPLLGVLLEKMLLPNGAVLPANFGARPMTEGDLIVRVGSDAINQAKTMSEALASLDAVIPFIEVPDLVYGSEVKMDVYAIAAINIGARYGILGEPIPLTNNQDWQTSLAAIRLEIIDENGTTLATGNSSALLGHPLSVVLWIKDTLKAQGKQLKKGDLLSLGTITPLIPVKPNSTIRAKYIGLDPFDPNKEIEISVKFE
ncbi:2-keto-4-pentenoate hydratase [Planktothricoides raciborskii]|uniref:Hydratase n=1 Tax=Planktothricoides raciborskii FACHB-1370 TaxID=2949576 RepID=A0ABR8EA83_9CYAN|nr:hydratase [Planktothricoides raciborskii]MBD2543759.1 hydratase [Planktothricoides raciborskii FACHB-1370]MBD2582346.1 hydratase [Planktothricoides raciborskii FACHB-1261]